MSAVDLGRIGIWWSRSWRSTDGSNDTAAEMESLGYSALWSSGRFDPGLAPHFERLLRSTSHVAVASGIVSIWTTEPGPVSREVIDLEERYSERFVFGIGASHSQIVQDYSNPYSKMVSYLDGLDSATTPLPAEQRVLAALGPRMLRLARDRARGAHPYFVPAEHTRVAREILGSGPLLAPEVTVVLESDLTKAREIARSFTAGYLSLPNYSQNLLSLGFGDDDIAGGGSDRLVDAVICMGDVPTLTRKVREHLDAGADHVCIQVITPQDGVFPLEEYRELAPALLEL